MDLQNMLFATRTDASKENQFYFESVAMNLDATFGNLLDHKFLTCSNVEDSHSSSSCFSFTVDSHLQKCVRSSVRRRSIGKPDSEP